MFRAILTKRAFSNATCNFSKAIGPPDITQSVTDSFRLFVQFINGNFSTNKYILHRTVHFNFPSSYYRPISNTSLSFRKRSSLTNIYDCGVIIKPVRITRCKWKLDLHRGRVQANFASLSFERITFPLSRDGNR